MQHKVRYKIGAPIKTLTVAPITSDHYYKNSTTKTFLNNMANDQRVMKNLPQSSF